MKDDTKPLGPHLRRGGPQVTVDFRQNELVAKVSKLYAQAAPEDQLALRVWMRDILLGRIVGTRNLAHASGLEKRSREACERRILDFPRDMDARKVAEELQREGWYSGGTNREYIVLRIQYVRSNVTA
jgi:hypothetical protein